MPFMNEILPDTAEAFGKLRDSIFEGGELDRKTKELIAVASSVLMRCQFCIDVHSQRAIAHGANKKEIAEAIAIAMFIAGGSQLGWTNIYGENVYDLIFEEKKPEEPEEMKLEKETSGKERSGKERSEKERSEKEKGCCCGD